jgi:hypothetical protein
LDATRPLRAAGLLDLGGLCDGPSRHAGTRPDRLDACRYFSYNPARRDDPRQEKQRVLDRNFSTAKSHAPNVHARRIEKSAAARARHPKKFRVKLATMIFTARAISTSGGPRRQC